MRLPSPRRMGLRGAAMEPFIKLFGDLLVFVYHCFDRIVIHGYLSGLSRPEQVVHFFRRIVGVPVKEVLSQRTTDYQKWVEAFARNHNIPIEWADDRISVRWLVTAGRWALPPTLNGDEPWKRPTSQPPLSQHT